MPAATKTSQASPEKAAPTLLPETVVQRKLPVNLHEGDLELFKHELERVIPQTNLLELKDVRVSADGILFRQYKMLPESFAFPSNMELWRRRSRLKFFVGNYVLRRSVRVEQPVLWITDDWSNGYFHWLSDALTRLYVMRDRLDGLLLLLPWDYEGRDFVRSSLRAFGVETVDFIAHDEVRLCSKVLMPTHTAPSGHYNEEIIRGVRSLLLQAYGAAQDSQEYERIYISRGRARKRRISNEAAVIEVLDEFDFKILYAEDLSFEQQVRICSRAHYLVSNHGAGLTNMLFMPKQAGVLELRHQTDCVNNCYFTLAAALDLNYFYQTCRSSNSDQNPHAADLVVDTEALWTNLRLMLAS